MGISVAPALGGKDLEVNLDLTGVITEVEGPVTQGHSPWMDLMDPTGEEKMWTGIQNKPLKTRTPGLKNPGSLIRSKGEDNKMRGALASRRTTQQQEVRGQMTPEEKLHLQTSGKDLRGAGQVQTLNKMITRGNTRRRRDARDQSNHPNHRLKTDRAQRGGPASKMSQATADHLRILPVKLDEAQDDTHPSRPEEGEEHIIKTTGQARGTGTRCRRARSRRQGV